MYLKFGKIKIHITFPFAVFIAFICNVSAGEKLALTFVCSILHECVHLAFLLGYGLRELCVTLNPGGAAIQCAGMDFLGTKKQVLTLVSAPIVNIFLGIILLAASRVVPIAYGFAPAYINIALGTVNLLPLPFLDGGRVLRAIAEAKFTDERTERICSHAGRIALSLLFAATGTMLLLRVNAFGLIVFTAYCLVVTVRQDFGKKMRK